MIGIFDIIAFQMYKIHQPSPDNYQKHEHLSILQQKWHKCAFMQLLWIMKFITIIPKNLSINNISLGGGRGGGSQIAKIELMLFMDSPLNMLSELPPNLSLKHSPNLSPNLSKMAFKLCSSSYALQATLFKLTASRLAMLFKLCSSS